MQASFHRTALYFVSNSGKRSFFFQNLSFYGLKFVIQVVIQGYQKLKQPLLFFYCRYLYIRVRILPIDSHPDIIELIPTFLHSICSLMD